MSANAHAMLPDSAKDLLADHAQIETCPRKRHAADVFIAALAAMIISAKGDLTFFFERIDPNDLSDVAAQYPNLPGAPVLIGTAPIMQPVEPDPVKLRAATDGGWEMGSWSGSHNGPSRYEG